MFWRPDFSRYASHTTVANNVGIEERQERNFKRFLMSVHNEFYVLKTLFRTCHDMIKILQVIQKNYFALNMCPKSFAAPAYAPNV